MTIAECLVIGLSWLLAVGLGLYLREARDARRHDRPPLVVRTDLRVEVPVTVTPHAAPEQIDGEIVADVERAVCAASGCEQPLPLGNGQQIYCSHACRQAAYRERKAA